MAEKRFLLLMAFLKMSTVAIPQDLGSEVLT
jgi:hypothetical protein